MKLIFSLKIVWISICHCNCDLVSPVKQDFLRGAYKVVYNKFVESNIRSSGYQAGSPWPNARGANNLNAGQSSLYGPVEKPSFLKIFENYSPEFLTNLAAVAADGTVYIALGTSMFALTPSGSVKWSFGFNISIGASPVIGQNGEIYISIGQLYCLSPQGSVEWLISGVSTDSVMLAADKTISFIGTHAVLYSVNPTGSTLWKYQVSKNTTSIPTPHTVNSNGTFHFGSSDTYLYAISSFGSLLWRFKTGASISSIAAVGYDDTVFIYSGDYYLYAVSPAGTLRWKRYPGGVSVLSPAISQDGSKVITAAYVTAGLRIYAIKIDSATPAWSYTTLSTYGVGSPVIGADDTIYISYDFSMIALSAQGSLLWRIIYNKIIPSPIIGGDGLIYTLSITGEFYSLKGKSAAPSSTLSPSLSSTSPSSSPSSLIVEVPSNSPFFQVTTSSPPSKIPSHSPFFLASPPSFLTSPPLVEPTLSPSSFFNTSSSSISSILISSSSKAGIIVGVLSCMFCFLAALLLWFCKKKTKRNDINVISEKVHLEESPRGYVSFASGNPSRFEYSTVEANSPRNLDFNNICPQNLANSSSNIGSANGIKSCLSSSSQCDAVIVPKVSWRDIELKSNFLDDCVIGNGTFGSVLLATMVSKNENGVTQVTEKNIVVKVFTKSISKPGDTEIAKEYLEIASREVGVVINAESKIVFKDCIVKVFGIVSGRLPSHMCQVMNVADDAEAVGIVMRYEEGGSLDAVIHPKSKSCKEVATVLTMKDKLFLLTGIARGIAELHSAGIVHGDIKPENILLNSKNVPVAEIRLADFGLAAIREESSALQSSLGQTAHTRGTPLYCAPEMLVNPYEDQVSDKVAKASRKTDVYAFAILAWEVLTEKEPFTDIKSEMVLSGKVHQGARPPIKDVPSTCPHQIVHMITSCWDADRSKRRTAVECFCTLKHYHGLMVNAVYDVYLICHSSKQALSDYIYNRLNQRGLNVLFINKNEQICQTFVGMDSATVTDDVEKTYMNDIISTSSTYANDIIGGMCSSQLIVVCIDQAFQDTESCLFEIKEARKLKPPRPIVPLFLDANQTAWLNDEVKYYCRLGDTSTQTFNISEPASDESWLSDEGPNVETIASLNAEMDALSDYIRQQVIITKSK